MRISLVVYGLEALNVLKLLGLALDLSRLVENLFCLLKICSLVQLLSRFALKEIISLAISACPSIVSQVKEFELVFEQLSLKSEVV